MFQIKAFNDVCSSISKRTVAPLTNEKMNQTNTLTSYMFIAFSNMTGNVQATRIVMA